jgi:hypothetical protein
MDWYADYEARNWDSVENWWRRSDDVAQLSALLTRLKHDVPKRTLHNGVDKYEEPFPSKDAPEEWRRAAAILELGELEAKVIGEPLSDPEIWAAQYESLTAELTALVDLPEVTEGDPVLSRRAHAERALEALRLVNKTIEFRIGLYEPDEQDALREFAADVAINALRAGYFSYAAESKSIQAHAVRGKKTVAGASVGGRERARETELKTEEILKRMRELTEGNNLSVSRAAEIAYKNGLGTSANANRQLWKRSKEK